MSVASHLHQFRWSPLVRSSFVSKLLLLAKLGRVRYAVKKRRMPEFFPAVQRTVCGWKISPGRAMTNDPTEWRQWTCWVHSKNTSSSAMAERPRDESAILWGWVTLRQNFRLTGYVSPQYLYGPLDGEMIKFSRKITLSQTLSDWNWILFKKSLFEPPFGGLRVTYALHL